ncbi:RagB/SusD family nutrient uptake outer membrane protein [Chitinophaga parva]|uniref:RagB/SusD family nutrient uptake outer membrane protein n=1 Tax=Chitinophaga parva TaxID=2169414 RepID=A0A2T7BIT8_9BACT|nr:RagB/SusD family nutrient uptake outer membrane protein [Chitinophaga parva]PUZ26184.1 RagB/SusD family nutrient uptake outer membrane protein [Chitinophaga parva]
MRKTTLLYISVVAALGLTACKKNFLDRTPLDSYSQSSLFTSANDAIAAVNGCYNGWEDGYNIIYMDCASDNAYGQYPWEGYTTHGNGYITPTDGDAASRWNFTTIQRVNWFMANIDKTPMDSALKHRVKGEARFLRAYQYFVMYELYGDVPLVTTQLTTQEANTVSRTDKATVYKFIMDELTEIAPDLPLSYTGSDVGRITRGAAISLKARLELYTGDYANCITDCKTIMGMGYTLFPNYQDLFRIQNNNNSETILNVQYKENDNPFESLGVMPSSGVGGWGSIDPTQALVDNYEMANGKTITESGSGYNPDDPYKNRDPRLSATIVYPGQLYQGSYYNSINGSGADYYGGNNNSKTAYVPKKYTSNLGDFNDMWNVGLDFPVIRYAEILLTFAEAKIESKQLDGEMYDAIDSVRVRAGMPKVDRTAYATYDKLQTLIRRERRSELAMEGLRWYDVKRWQIGDKVMAGAVYGARTGNVNASTGALTLTGAPIKAEDRVFDPKKNYLWPIPQKEIDVNKNLKQNDLY